MADFVTAFVHAFALLLTPTLLAACILGLVARVVGGFLPALSPLGTVALALSLAGATFVAFGLESPVVFAISAAYGTLYGRALAVRNLATPDAAKDVPDRKRADLPERNAQALNTVSSSPRARSRYHGDPHVDRDGVDRRLRPVRGPHRILSLKPRASATPGNGAPSRALRPTRQGRRRARRA